MSRRRLMVGKEYKFIKNAQKLSITNVVSQNNINNAGNLFNNYTTNASDNFEVIFTVRVDEDNAYYNLVINYYDASNYWDIAVRNGYIEYRERYDGNTMTVNFSRLGKIEKGKWYTVGIKLSNSKVAYCKINNDTYTSFDTDTRRRMSISNNREIFFGRDAGDGVDFRGELKIVGFSSNHTKNIGVWNIDDMSLGNNRYMNGSGGTPSSLRLSVMNSTVCLGRE